MCQCIHALAPWALSLVDVYMRIVTGAGGGAACYLQELIRKKKKACSFLSGPKSAEGMKQPSSPLTLLSNILIYTASREVQAHHIPFTILSSEGP